MSSQLAAHLSFVSSSSSARSPLPPAGTTVLVTDTVAASADFLLLHLVGAQLRRSGQVVFVGLAEGEGHWRALGKKLGTTLDANAGFTFVDGLSHAYSFPSAASGPASAAAEPRTCPPLLNDSTLRPLYDLVRSTLKGKARASNTGAQEDEPEVLLVVEGLSALVWSGVEAEEVARLMRALSNLSSEMSLALVAHLHTTPSTGALPTDALFQTLHPAADLWVEVRGLSSGRSADVSGELAFHPSPLMAHDGAFPATQRGKELQYKLGDSAVEYFAKGTGRGFL